MPELLGIDNVLFTVRDLGEAVRFYETCGLRLRFKVEPAGIALFDIGREAPGLLVRVGPAAGSGRFWVEVRDAGAAALELEVAGIATARLETSTGVTVEAADPSGNVIGFADYSRTPELARSLPSIR